MHYLVTGGAGFIGTHLVQCLLRGGHKVTVLDDLSTGKRESVPVSARFLAGDIRDSAQVVDAMHGVDGVFHLAAVASVRRSIENWKSVHEINLTGFINVLDAARRMGRLPVIYASSAAVYGLSGQLPLREDALPAPMSPYGADKLGCEAHAQAATAVFGLPTVGLRFFNVYGPGQDPHSQYSGVISIFAGQAIAELKIVIVGDGLQTRDFIYVSDVVDCLVKAMKNHASAPKVLNVCTGRTTNLLELAAAIERVWDVRLEISHAAERVGDIRSSCGSSELVIKSLDLGAGTTLLEGLSELRAAQVRAKTIAAAH